MTFKPTVFETPKSESVPRVDRMTGEPASEDSTASGTGQPGDPAAIAPPRDLATSRFQPIQFETPQAPNVPEYAPGTGQPGTGFDSDRGYGLSDGPPRQRQAVKDDRGVVTTFLSDLPQK